MPPHLHSHHMASLHVLDQHCFFTHFVYVIFVEYNVKSRIVFVFYSLTNKHIFLFFCAGEGKHAKIQYSTSNAKCTLHQQMTS